MQVHSTTWYAKIQSPLVFVRAHVYTTQHDNKRWQTAHYPLHGFHLYMYARCSQCCHHNRSTTLLAFILRTLNRLLKGYCTSCTRPTRQATEAVTEPPQSFTHVVSNLTNNPQDIATPYQRRYDLVQTAKLTSHQKSIGSFFKIFLKRTGAHPKW